MSSEFAWDESTNLVDLLLSEQRHLTAVDEFSSHYESANVDAKRYESLLPTSLPNKDQQYAFRVDLESCTGCKSCVTACHNLNGLDEDETWRKVGLIEGSESTVEPSSAAQNAHQQTVTTACHHCEDPACLAGCPVKAYDKDPITGIVRHLDDQCIGCRYCQLMCPYDVPTYSERLGIVRKCDMCHDRLAEGEAPACVQGCPNEAISIKLVDTSGVKTNAAGHLLHVSAGSMPISTLTRPTTEYANSKSGTKPLSPVGLLSPRPAEAHDPLAIMLVLTQVSIGLLLVDTVSVLVSQVLEPAWSPSRLVLSFATITGLLGLAASTSHLGRPQWAFRAILGLRTSWMSREIVVLGGYAGALVAACALRWVLGGDWDGPTAEIRDRLTMLAPWIGLAASSVGLAGLYCSVKIYSATGRPLWRIDRTATRFLLTAAWMGLASSPLVLIAGLPTSASTNGTNTILCAFALCLMALTSIRLRFESGRAVRSHEKAEMPALERSRKLLAGELAHESQRRRQLLILAGIGLPAVQLAALGFALPFLIQGALSVCILIVGIASDIKERSLFFRSEAMPSMPGVE